MKNFFSNFYHKFIRYKFYDNIESINYKQLCEFEKFPSELYRVKLFEQLDTKKITSVLDYGCGYGLNMKIIKKLNQNIKLNCMEISEEKKKMLNIINENIYKMSINQLNIQMLNKYKSQFDLVFTDAVLIYVGKNKIFNVIKNLINSSKKTILFHELTNEYSSEAVKHLYLHDYRLIIKQINPKLKVKFYKSNKPGSPWKLHGTKIIIEK